MTDNLPSPEATSPPWSAPTKLVVGLTLVAVTGGMVVYFRSILGWLLLAFVLTYLLHPIVAGFSRLTHLPWRASVNIIYLLLLAALVGSFTATGLVIIQQFQSLIVSISVWLTTLPEQLGNISQVYTIGGVYTLDLTQLDLVNLGQQIIAALQGILGQAGILLSTIATRAINLLGWMLFVILLSYFTLADAGQVPDMVNYLHIPGYDYDIRRMGREIDHIWNAFLRGQLLIISMVIIASAILMNILGVRFAFSIALLTGLARFVPYIGTFTVDAIIFLVAFFQNGNYFGLSQWGYALLVLGLAMLLDQIFDNFISPRILGQQLGVHPAAVLLAAIVAARLLGLVGLVLAAPVLASLRLIVRYVLRKMLDLPPWPDPETPPPPFEIPGLETLKSTWRKIRLRRAPKG